MTDILREAAGGLLRLTLNRPAERNALTAAMLEGLGAALKSAERDAAVRAVIVTGAGRAFCAGQDLKEFAERGSSFEAQLRGLYNPLILRLRRCPKPVIAAVNGAAAGAGLGLALACDFRVASADAKFHTAFVKVGLVPDSGTLLHLALAAGFPRALELAMTGRPVDAAEAERLGLVHRVAAPDRLLEEAAAFARPLVEGPPSALGLIKRLWERALFARSLEDMLETEALYQEAAGRSPDYAEGAAAFREKRAPRFGAPA